MNNIYDFSNGIDYCNNYSIATITLPLIAIITVEILVLPNPNFNPYFKRSLG